MANPPPPVPRPGSAAGHDGRKLFRLGLAGTAVLLGYYGATANVADPTHLQQGLLMLFFAILPSLLWARRGSSQLPAFEVLLLTTANAYAMPLLNGHVQLPNYKPEIITESANLVLLYQAIAIGAHQIFRARPATSPLFRNEVLTRDLQKYVRYGLLLSTAFSVVTVFFSDLVPYELGSILRAVFAGIGLVATFSLSRQWGQGALSPSQRTFLISLITIQALAQFSTLFLVTGMSTVMVALIGYVSGSRRLPLLSTLLLFAVTALLHNGKSAMRAKYWSDDGVPRTMEIQQMPAFYAEWLEASLSQPGSRSESEMTKKLFDRTSLFHILCLVTSLTPEHEPYLNGQTYGYIPSQLVPRFFWPDKPQAHIATSALAIHYGLQTEETVKNATIGFGMLAEAYANFGLLGVGLLGFLFGAVYKGIAGATAGSPILSYPGLFLIILTSWSFQVESTMAIWLSSMFQACVAVLGVPFIIRNLFG